MSSMSVDCYMRQARQARQVMGGHRASCEAVWKSLLRKCENQSILLGLLNLPAQLPSCPRHSFAQRSRSNRTEIVRGVCEDQFNSRVDNDSTKASETRHLESCFGCSASFHFCLGVCMRITTLRHVARCKNALSQAESTK